MGDIDPTYPVSVFGRLKPSNLLAVFSQIMSKGRTDGAAEAQPLEMQMRANPD